MKRVKPLNPDALHRLIRTGTDYIGGGELYRVAAATYAVEPGQPALNKISRREALRKLRRLLDTHGLLAHNLILELP